MAFVFPGFGSVGIQNQRQDESGKAAAEQGELYPVDNRQAGVKFQLNPQSIQRRRMPVYAEVGAAAADYWASYDGPSPLQWVRNPSEQISFELLFYATGTSHVEEPLNKLRKMMARVNNSPRGQSAGPSDLIFKYGSRSDRVRITGLEIDEEQHTAKLEVQRAKVKIDLKTVKLGAR